MREHTDIIVHDLRAYAMISTQELKGQIRRKKHRLWIMLKTHQRHIIIHHHVHFILFTSSGRIIRRLHRPVVTERRIILCLHPLQGHQ